MDLPTIRQNPRRFLKVYLEITTSPAGLFHVTAGDVRTSLISGPQEFHGNYYQVMSLEFWGTPSVLGNTPARLHIKDYITGIDGDDREVGPNRPRVGLKYPQAARQVMQPGDDTLILVEGTNIPVTSTTTCQCIITAMCW